MKLSNVARLYAARLRTRFGQELLALIGIAVGVSLLFAALVANTSLTSSFDRTLEGVVGDARWQLSARGSAISERTAEEVRELPSVAAAAPVLETRTEVRGPNGTRSILLIGVNEEFARVNGRQTQKLSAAYLAGQSAIALPAVIASDLGLKLGQTVDLTIGGRRVRAPLGALLEREQIGELIDTPLGLAPLHYAQTLVDAPGAASRIFVVPKPGQDSDAEKGLRQLAGERMGVRPARFEGDVFRQAAQPTSQSTAMFSVFSALVGFLFAFSSVLLTVPDRRRLIADLSLEGYVPRTVLKVMLFDALVLGIAGSALGILIGEQVSRRLFDETPSFLQVAFTFSADRIVTPGSVAIAAIGGILASCVAVLGPTISAIFRSPQWKADRRRDEPGARVDALVVGGAASLAAALAIVVSSPGSAAIGIAGLALLTLSMLLLLPTFLRVAVGGLARATRGLRTVVPFLASVDLRDGTTRVRALAVAATGAVAVFGSVALQGAHGDLQRGLDRTSRDLVSVGDVWVMAPDEANLLATIPFAVPRETPATAGVATVSEFRSSFLDIGERRAWVVGAPATARYPIPRDQTLEGDEDAVTGRLRAGGWVVLSAGVADDLGVGVGDEVTLPTPRPVKLRVAALSTNIGWPPGAAVMNADDYAVAWGRADVSALTATLAPGAASADAKRTLAAALGSDSGLVVRTADDRWDELKQGSRQGLKRLTQIAALVLLAAMIAMAAAMAGLIWQRRPFYAAVKVEGYGVRDLWRALLLESTILIGVGCAAGAFFGLVGQQLLSRALTNVTGFPVRYELAAAPALLSCIAVVIVSVAIVAGFGYYTARVEARPRSAD